MVPYLAGPSPWPTLEREPEPVDDQPPSGVVIVDREPSLAERVARPLRTWVPHVIRLREEQ